MSVAHNEPLLAAAAAGAGAAVGAALGHGKRRTVHTGTQRAFVTATTVVGVMIQAYDMFGDYYLAFTKYLAHGDRLYFGWSLAFSLLTTLGFWYMGLRGRSIFAGDAGERTAFIQDDDASWSARIGRVALCVPVLASLAVPIYAPTTALWALVCGSFPQYIIAFSYSLESRELSTAQLVSLSGSLFALIFSPIHIMAKDDTGGVQRPDEDSLRALACTYLGWAGRRLLVLGPVILIEVIHFLPVLIERYYYHGLTRSGYIGCLVAFNVPKLLFLLQRRKRKEVPGRLQRRRRQHLRLGWPPPRVRQADLRLHRLYSALLPSLAIIFPCAVLLWDHGNVHDLRGAGLLSGVAIGSLLALYLLRRFGLLNPDGLFIATHRGWFPVLVVMPLVPCVAIIESERKKKDEDADTRATFHTHLLVVYMLLSYGSLGFLFRNRPGACTIYALIVCYVLLCAIALTWLCYHEAVIAFTMTGSSIVDKLDSGGDDVGWQQRLKVAQDEGQAELDLSNCNIDVLGAQHIASQLPRCRALKSANLAGNSVGDRGAIAISAALETNGTLTALNVSGNDIGDRGKSAIGDALLSSSTSKLQYLKCSEWNIEANTSSLDLSGQNLGPADAKLLAGVMKINRALKSANLADNDIGDDGAVAISAALENNTTLTDLNLQASYRGVKITATGAQAIAKMLVVNRALTSLDLQDNEIGAGGAKAIAAALPQS